MKIPASYRVHVDVEISDEQWIKLTIAFLEKIYGGSLKGLSIKGDDLVSSWEEWGGQHSWTESKVLRKATEIDKSFVEMYQRIYDEARSMKVYLR